MFQTNVLLCVLQVCVRVIYFTEQEDDLIELELIELQEKREELLNLLDEMEISNPAYNDLEDEIEYLDNLINNLL